MPFKALEKRIDPNSLNLKEQVVSINRVTKVVKGGKNMSFSALVVVGDPGQKIVGFGTGKAKEVPAAIKKGIEIAKKNMVQIAMKGSTIPHAAVGHYGAGKVLLKPAAPGTGVIAGGAARAILEAAGIHDILAKSMGSTNSINVAHATIAGLKGLKRPDEVARMRGKSPEEVTPAGVLRAYQESERAAKASPEGAAERVDG